MRIAGFAALAALAAPARAEESPEAPEQTVVTARRLAEAARPDTERRLTSTQLAELGATDLGQALDLVTDTPVRGSGRQLAQANVRGARKGGVLILLDGIPLSDPFHGNFDVASIPVADIAEIRVSLTPASPLDGPGGNGGVIEVLTRSATGPAYLRAQAQGGTAPSLNGALSGRHGLGGLGVRASATGSLDARSRQATLPDGRRTTLDGDDRAATAGLRLEHENPRGRLSLDAAFTHREYGLAPSEVAGAPLARVPEARTLRAVAGGRWRTGGATASLRAYTLRSTQEGVTYDDARAETVTLREQVESHRTGGQGQVDLPLGEDVRATAVLHVLVEGGQDRVESGGGVQTTEGTSPVVEPAAGALWRVSERFTLEGAAGLAAPLGEARGPAWPEAKIAASLLPHESLTLRLTAARKGRLPSLRDRYSPHQGNPAVRPEMGTSGEGSAEWRPLEVLRLSASLFVRRTDDLIRNPPADGEAARGIAPVENFGRVDLRGGEAAVELGPLRSFTWSTAYAYIDAHSNELGTEPLDFLPHHRLDTALTWRPLAKGGLWSRVRFVGEQLDAGARLEAHATLDAAAWYGLGPARLTLRGENLTDQRYLARAAVQADGRTLYLGAEGTWE